MLKCLLGSKYFLRYSVGACPFSTDGIVLGLVGGGEDVWNFVETDEVVEAVGAMLCACGAVVVGGGGDAKG